MLNHYRDLYYENPNNEFERSVNSNLDNLCVAAQQCGWQSIVSQERLKKLKTMSKDEREKVYQVAMAAIKN